MAAAPAGSYVQPMSEPVTASPSLLARLGPRARRRAQPRASIAAGWRGLRARGGRRARPERRGSHQRRRHASTGGRASSSPRVVAASGFVVQHLFPRTPLATAGTVAVILSVPVVVAFATLDPDGATAVLRRGHPHPLAARVRPRLRRGSRPGSARLPRRRGDHPVGVGAPAVRARLRRAPGILGVFVFPVFPFWFTFESATYGGDGDEIRAFGGLHPFDADHRRGPLARGRHRVRRAQPAVRSPRVRGCRHPPAGGRLPGPLHRHRPARAGPRRGRHGPRGRGRRPGPRCCTARPSAVGPRPGSVPWWSPPGSCRSSSTSRTRPEPSACCSCCAGSGSWPSRHLWAQQGREPDELAVAAPGGPPRRTQPLRCYVT